MPVWYHPPPVLLENGIPAAPGQPSSAPIYYYPPAVCVDSSMDAVLPPVGFPAPPAAYTTPNSPNRVGLLNDPSSSYHPLGSPPGGIYAAPGAYPVPLDAIPAGEPSFRYYPAENSAAPCGYGYFDPAQSPYATPAAVHVHLEAASPPLQIMPGQYPSTYSPQCQSPAAQEQQRPKTPPDLVTEELLFPSPPGFPLPPYHFRERRYYYEQDRDSCGPAHGQMSPGGQTISGEFQSSGEQATNAFPPHHFQEPVQYVDVNRCRTNSASGAQAPNQAPVSRVLRFREGEGGNSDFKFTLECAGCGKEIIFPHSDSGDNGETPDVGYCRLCDQRIKRQQQEAYKKQLERNKSIEQARIATWRIEEAKQKIREEIKKENEATDQALLLQERRRSRQFDDERIRAEIRKEIEWEEQQKVEQERLEIQKVEEEKRLQAIAQAKAQNEEKDKIREAITMEERRKEAVLLELKRIEVENMEKEKLRLKSEDEQKRKEEESRLREVELTRLRMETEAREKEKAQNEKVRLLEIAKETERRAAAEQMRTQEIENLKAEERMKENIRLQEWEHRQAKDREQYRLLLRAQEEARNREVVKERIRMELEYEEARKIEAEKATLAAKEVEQVQNKERLQFEEDKTRQRQLMKDQEVDYKTKAFRAEAEAIAKAERLEAEKWANERLRLEAEKNARQEVRNELHRNESLQRENKGAGRQSTLEAERAHRQEIEFQKQKEHKLERERFRKQVREEIAKEDEMARLREEVQEEIKRELKASNPNITNHLPEPRNIGSTPLLDDSELMNRLHNINITGGAKSSPGKTVSFSEPVTAPSGARPGGSHTRSWETEYARDQYGGIYERRSNMG